MGAPEHIQFFRKTINLGFFRGSSKNVVFTLQNIKIMYMNKSFS